MGVLDAAGLQQGDDRASGRRVRRIAGGLGQHGQPLGELREADEPESPLAFDAGHHLGRLRGLAHREEERGEAPGGGEDGGVTRGLPEGHQAHEEATVAPEERHVLVAGVGRGEGEIGAAETAVGPLLREQPRHQRGEVGGGASRGRQHRERFDPASGQVAAEVPEAAAGVERHVGEDEVLRVGGDAGPGEAAGREVDTPGEIAGGPCPGDARGDRARGGSGGTPPRGRECGPADGEPAEECPPCRPIVLHRRPPLAWPCRSGQASSTTRRQERCGGGLRRGGKGAGPRPVPVVSTSSFPGAPGRRVPSRPASDPAAASRPAAS